MKEGNGQRKMGRTTWIDVDGMKKGEWTAEEDQKLVSYINQHGLSDWRSLPECAGLQRSGKSCRLRWLNYLKPGIRRGKFTPQEEEDIIKLHALLGNRWAAIAKQMDNRTDNDIKNHWNSCPKKRLLRKGIDPMTHERIINNLEEGSSSYTTSPSMGNPLSSGSASLLNKLATGISSRQQSLDTIKHIFSNPNIKCREQDDEEKERESDIAQNIGVGDEEENSLNIWDEEDVKRLMMIDAMEYEMTWYDCVR